MRRGGWRTQREDVSVISVFRPNVDKVAEEIEEAEKKAFILNWVTSIPMLVPAAGGILTQVGLRTLGPAIGLSGELGNAALGIYGIVESSETAIFPLFGALLGARDFGKAASYRRGLSTAEISNQLGSKVAGSVSKVDRAKVGCI